MQVILLSSAFYCISRFLTFYLTSKFEYLFQILIISISFGLKLPNIDLASYYSPLVPQRARHDDAPVVMSLENATFRFDRLRCRDGVEHDQIKDFWLNAVNMDVKKVRLENSFETIR